MPSHFETSSTVEAEIHELLPRLGLAYAVDDSARSWGITRSTPGLEFDALAPGRRVQLLVHDVAGHAVVRECRVSGHESPGRRPSRL